MMFVLHFDGPYMKWTDIFIRTIERFEPQAKIYINGINLTRRMIKRLRKSKNIVEIKNEKIRLHASLEGQQPKGGGWMAQIISMRAGVFVRAIQEYPNEDIYITCDVDMLLIKCLDDLRESMKGKDLGLCVFPEMRSGTIPLDRNKVMATFICARKTKSSMKYLKLWDKLSRENYVRTIDQIALVNAYEKLKGNLDIYILPRSYLDIQFDSNSYLLSAHKSVTGSKRTKFKLFKYFTDNFKDNDIEDLIREINKRRLRTLKK